MTEPSADPTAAPTPEPGSTVAADLTGNQAGAAAAPAGELALGQPVEPPAPPTAPQTYRSVASTELAAGADQTAAAGGLPPHGLVRIVLEPVHRDLGTHVASAGGEVVTHFSTTGLTAGVYTVTWTPLDERGRALTTGD